LRGASSPACYSCSNSNASQAHFPSSSRLLLCYLAPHCFLSAFVFVRVPSNAFPSPALAPSFHFPELFSFSVCLPAGLRLTSFSLLLSFSCSEAGTSGFLLYSVLSVHHLAVAGLSLFCSTSRHFSTIFFPVPPFSSGEFRFALPLFSQVFLALACLCRRSSSETFVSHIVSYPSISVPSSVSLCPVSVLGMLNFFSQSTN